MLVYIFVSLTYCTTVHSHDGVSWHRATMDHISGLIAIPIAGGTYHIRIAKATCRAHLETYEMMSRKPSPLDISRETFTELVLGMFKSVLDLNGSIIDRMEPGKTGTV